MSANDASTEVVFARVDARVPHPDAITVAVSLYNYARFLPECLGSVLAQTHPHVEVVVVDDHSTLDGSADMARAWAEQYAGGLDRFMLLRHGYNRGLAAARNTAFAQARTDHVFVLDADNALHARALEVLHRAAVEADLDATYSQLELFGDQYGIGQADVWSRHRLRRGNYVDAMALVRVRSWRQVGGYTHLEGGWEDYDFWCKFVENGMTGLYVPEILCRYRVHGTSMLRVDTAFATEALKVQMSCRHPWLTL